MATKREKREHMSSYSSISIIIELKKAFYKNKLCVGIHLLYKYLLYLVLKGIIFHSSNINNDLLLQCTKPFINLNWVIIPKWPIKPCYICIPFLSHSDFTWNQFLILIFFVHCFKVEIKSKLLFFIEITNNFIKIISFRNWFVL